MTKEIAEKNRINKQGVTTSITIKLELKVADQNRSITSIKSDVNKILNNQLKGVKVKDVLLSHFS
jgi:flagellar basal body-associated protein FliL